MLLLAVASGLLTPGLCLSPSTAPPRPMHRRGSVAHASRAHPKCDAGPLPRKELPRDEQGLPAGKVYAPRRLQHSAALHNLDTPPTDAGARRWGARGAEQRGGRGAEQRGGRGGEGRGARGGEERGATSGGSSSQPPRVRKQGKEPQVRELQRLMVSGGDHRGRRIQTPAVYMRPMMSRVREALFSMVYPTGVLRESAAVLDLFSGSGVVGIEALSRGVGRATFVDFSPVRSRQGGAEHPGSSRLCPVCQTASNAPHSAIQMCHPHPVRDPNAPQVCTEAILSHCASLQCNPFPLPFPPHPNVPLPHHVPFTPHHNATSPISPFPQVCTEAILSNCASLGEASSVSVIEADVYSVLSSPERHGLGGTHFDMVTVRRLTIGSGGERGAGRGERWGGAGGDSF
jgi:hypothetical protein